MNDKQILRTIHGAIKEFGLSKFSPSKTHKKLMRTYLPYCVLPGGFVVNREYKPIGVAGYSNYINYEDYPCKASNELVLLFLRSGSDFLMSKDDGVSVVYLYSDESAPYESKRGFAKYMKNLEGIMQFCDINDISDEWESAYSMNKRYGDLANVMVE